MNIGDNVEYENEYGDKCNGSIVNIQSDMDSYDEMRLENGVPLYYSKKLKKYVPVKPKNMDTIFFTIPQRASDDFVLVQNILGSTDGKEANNA